MSSGFSRRSWATPTRLVVLSFGSLVLAGTLLLMLPVSTEAHVSPSLVDAAFTATSAVCVTGLVVENTASYWSLTGQVVIMLLIQVGGLGLMVFSTMHALFTGRRIGLRERLLIQEQTGQARPSGVVSLVRRIVIATLVFELLGSLVLGLAFGTLRKLSVPEALFQGVFHSVSAFCNAGFDILGSSLLNYRSSGVIILTIGILIIAGGIGFHVLVDLYENKSGWSGLSLHSKIAIKLTVALIVMGTLSYLALEWSNPGTLGGLGLRDKLLSAWFQAVTPRTAGFNSIPVENLVPPSALLTIVLMFIGASPGGTGGGIKTTTFAVVLRSLEAVVWRERDVTFEKRRLPQDVVAKATAILLLSLGLIAVSTMILSGTEKAPFLDLLFEVTSAFGTVGLSRGITGDLTCVGKIVVMVTMFAGRVGPLSLVVALSGQKDNSAVRYPEERVSVG